jgi:hypothetical protein
VVRKNTQHKKCKKAREYKKIKDAKVTKAPVEKA